MYSKLLRITLTTTATYSYRGSTNKLVLNNGYLVNNKNYLQLKLQLLMFNTVKQMCVFKKKTDFLL